MTEKRKEKFVIIDGNSLIHRAFYALPPTMQTARGEHTNAVYGFLSMLFKLLEEEQPDLSLIHIYGTMARVPQLQEFCREHCLKLITIADLIQYLSLIHI